MNSGNSEKAVERSGIIIRERKRGFVTRFIANAVISVIGSMVGFWLIAAYYKEKRRQFAEQQKNRYYDYR